MPYPYTHDDPYLSGSERRTEPRFVANGIGDLLVFERTEYKRLTAAVVDVSRSGLQVELIEWLPLSSRVEIRLRDVIVMGKVSYCRSHEEDKYRIGIQIREIVDSPLQARHLGEVELELYLVGNGLTEAERYFYTAHLEMCVACTKSMEDVKEFLANVAAVRARMPTPTNAQ